MYKGEGEGEGEVGEDEEEEAETNNCFINDNHNILRIFFIFLL